MKDQEILENLNWLKDGRLAPHELQMVVDQISHQFQLRKLDKKKLTPEVVAAITQRIVESHLYTKVVLAAMPQARTYEREKVVKEIFETWKCEKYDTINCDKCTRCQMKFKLVGI